MKWVWVTVPALLGLLGAILINTFSPVNPVFYLRASLSVLFLFLGVLISLLSGLIIWLRKHEQQRQQTLAAALQELAADRRRFLRRLDHELKNPLTAIRTGLVNVADAQTDALRQDALETVQLQTMRLSRLTADLRKIADLETRPLECSAIDLSLLLADVVDAAAELPETAVHTLHLTLPQAPWPLPTIQGDRDLLFLAVYNLLDNALKYTPSGGTIELRAREDARLVIIEAADTGPGIPDDEINQVWNELYRGSSAQGRAGSGLGLSLVKAIVDRHGGQVGLHSRTGQGTMVSLLLPIDFDC